VRTHDTAPAGAGVIERELLAFLETRLRASAALDEDLFGTGLVSSMFVMELVVHLEQEYEIAIVGADLKMENFRTVSAMTKLILRLREQETASGD
jgi:methoxymalonate biosynthesis acyl carrier protein